MNVLFRPIPLEHEELVVLSIGMRLYATLSSKGDSVHVVQPGRLDDPRVGDGKVIAGELVCTCPAGQFGRQCWAVKFAIGFEQGSIGHLEKLRAALPDEDIAWLRDPVGAPA